MDHGVYDADEPTDQRLVGDVALPEREARIGIVWLELGTRSADRQPVEHRDAGARLREQHIHQVGADEPGPTGDKDVVGGHRRQRTPAAVSRAERCHVNDATRAVPAARSTLRRSSSPSTSRRPAAIAAGSSGSTSTAASPATSGSEEVFEVRTGTFAATPSRMGKPKPSARDGYARISAPDRSVRRSSCST